MNWFSVIAVLTTVLWPAIDAFQLKGSRRMQRRLQSEQSSNRIPGTRRQLWAELPVMEVHEIESLVPSDDARTLNTWQSVACRIATLPSRDSLRILGRLSARTREAISATRQPMSPYCPTEGKGRPAELAFSSHFRQTELLRRDAQGKGPATGARNCLRCVGLAGLQDQRDPVRPGMDAVVQQLAVVPADVLPVLIAAVGRRPQPFLGVPWDTNSTPPSRLMDTAISCDTVKLT